MLLYKIEGEYTDPTGKMPKRELILTFEGTQKDASKATEKCKTISGVDPTTVSWSEENVPTVKKDLLAWLNKHTVLG
jgi:hypothetical protein